MPRKTNTQIVKSNLIICEGRDEQEFLIKYLNSDILSSVPGFSNDIQVIDFGGNSELARKLAILKNMENFDKLTSLLIIRDAETNAESACLEIQRALKQNGFPIPQGPHCWEGQTLKTGFLLFPNCDCIVQNGTLEDLCLSILSDPLAAGTLEEIDLFLKRLEKYRHEPFSRVFKTKLHTCFSVHNDYVSLKIGEAAAAGAFDWNSPALDPLKNFIQEIL